MYFLKKEEIEKYLKRINFSDEIIPNKELLFSLQKLHLLNVPFENLDIPYGNKIVLDIQKIYDKIINRTRGGFCYELNGLFYTLLKTLGFDVKRISAKVYNNTTKEYGPEFDHLAIMVNLDGTEYLSDVGFGEFSLAPLKFELNKIQKDERGNFIFDKFDDDYFRISIIEKDQKIPQYIFKNINRDFSEFEEMCNYHQTSPDSHFTKGKLLSIPTKNGRVTLTNDKLKILENNEVKEIQIIDEKDFEEKLKKYFEMKISEIKNQ